MTHNLLQRYNFPVLIITFSNLNLTYGVNYSYNCQICYIFAPNKRKILYPIIGKKRMKVER